MSSEETGPNQTIPWRLSSPAARAAVFCSGAAVLIMAFLIPFALLGKCSGANIAIFIVLLFLSAGLSLFAGALTIIKNWKAKSQASLVNFIFQFVYICELIVMLRLFYS